MCHEEATNSYCMRTLNTISIHMNRNRILRMSLLSASLILILLVTNTTSYRILKYSKYRYSTSLKNTNSSSLSTVDLSNEDLLDYLQEAKPSKMYKVMDNFRDAKFSVSVRLGFSNRNT